MAKKATKKKTSKKTAAKKKKSIKKKAAKKKNKNQKEEKKKGKNPWLFLTIAVIIVAAVLFVGAYMPEYLKNKEREDNRFNQFDFLEDENGFWYVNLQINDRPTSILFRHHPNELLDIQMQQEATLLIPHLANLQEKGKETQLYISFDPNDEEMLVGFALASVEIARITGQKFDIYNIPTTGAVLTETNQTSSTPVITCDDVNSRTGVITMQRGEENKINVPSPNCIVIIATNETELVRVADRFAYELLGVIEGGKV